MLPHNSNALHSCYVAVTSKPNSFIRPCPCRHLTSKSPTFKPFLTAGKKKNKSLFWFYVPSSTQRAVKLADTHINHTIQNTSNIPTAACNYPEQPVVAHTPFLQRLLPIHDKHLGKGARIYFVYLPVCCNPRNNIQNFQQLITVLASSTSVASLTFCVSSISFQLFVTPTASEPAAVSGITCLTAAAQGDLLLVNSSAALLYMLHLTAITFAKCP